MNAFAKKAAAFVLALVMAVGMITGCSTSKDLKTENGNKVLFTYNNTETTLKEAWIYAKMSAAQYNSYYGMYYGADFWNTPVSMDEEGNMITFEQMAKQQVVNQIKQVIVLNSKAEEMGIALTEEEKKQCAEYAKAFAETEEGAAILKECGASQDDMAAIYEKNMIASKVQEEAVKDADKNVSDDEARITTIERIVYPVTKTDDDGKTVDLDDAEKAVVKQTAEAALKKIKSGTALSEVAEAAEYSNTSEDFAKGASEEGKKFEEKLASMKDGDLMDEVMECANGFVVAKLVAYTDREKTDENKETIIGTREQEVFSAKYDEWTADLEKDWDYKTDVDQALWDEVILHTEEPTTEAAGETEPAEETSTEAK